MAWPVDAWESTVPVLASGAGYGANHINTDPLIHLFTSPEGSSLLYSHGPSPWTKQRCHQRWWRGSWVNRGPRSTLEIDGSWAWTEPRNCGIWAHVGCERCSHQQQASWADLECSEIFPWEGRGTAHRVKGDGQPFPRRLSWPTGASHKEHRRSSPCWAGWDTSTERPGAVSVIHRGHGEWSTFYKPIKRNKVAFFRHEQAASSSKENVLKDDCQLFSRLFISCQTRQCDKNSSRDENQPTTASLSDSGKFGARFTLT